MQRIELQTLITQSLNQQWDLFAQAHPLLASVIDRELATEQCLTDLRKDPELLEATAQVEAAGMATQALQGLVTRLVTTWFARV